MNAPPRLEARQLWKAYGQVEALKGVDLEIDGSEVVALMGDNGAGKSTVVKILSGALRADSGDVLVDGEPKVFRSPVDARREGIETVYQDLALAEDLPIWANLFLGREVLRGAFRRNGVPTWPRWLDKRVMRQRASHELGGLGVPIPSVDATIAELSGGQRQAVAVARGVAWGRKLVLMDEPTANLGVDEQRNVHRLIRLLVEVGIPVLLISHNLHEVFSVASRIVVLRRGERVAAMATTETNTDEVIAYITGARTRTGMQGAAPA